MGRMVLGGGRTEVSGNGVVVGLAILAIVVGGLGVGFGTGMVETLGYESRSLMGNGLTSMKSGYSLGINTFYFFKGQEFFADYEADIREGALIVHLYKFGSMPTSDSPYFHKINQSGKGTVLISIRESGLYRMNFSGSVLGAKSGTGRYDLSYQMRWGIR